MEIGEYVDLIAQGRVMEALQVIRAGNPFPAICGHVCSHPCEEACRRRQVDSPVSIRSLKRFAIEFGGDRMIRLEAETTRSDKVAVVGSGPAGLAAAYYLRKMGYPVTIFEAHSDVGGMLRVGIPEYRLPREVLDVEVQRLTQMGVEIRTNTRVVSLDLLFELGYKAAFITVGAHQSLRMRIEGEDSPGVVDGATCLREVNLGLKPAVGNTVAVVGGGNVAIDATRTALRLGADKVTLLYRRSREQMPADPAEVDQALEEGAEIQFLASPTQIARNRGQLQVSCTRYQLGEPDASGRPRPVPVEGSEFTLEFDTLISAIGQAPRVPEDFRLRIGRGSTIQVDPVTLLTNRRGVFAGGDAVTGPATVVQALAFGRQAASRIAEYLEHRYPLPPKESAQGVTTDLLPTTVDVIRKAHRLDPQLLIAEERIRDFRPVELIYDWQSAIDEARRCLRCGMGAEILFQDQCATCLNCLRVCPYHVPYVDDSGTIQIPPDQCQACGICVAECPASAIVLRKPRDRRHIDEELDHILRSAPQSPIQPLIIGFGCQYGLFGTGTLAGLWKRAQAAIWIVPVLCVATVEPEHIMRAFERGAEGVFIAGCGEQCARENTAFWMSQRVAKVRKALLQLGLEAERVESFNLQASVEDPVAALDRFTQRIGELRLAQALQQEVES
jgi:NADPH-dependent glutamate synthase beta subunit-like oxidoreductase/coenzyme F420-reducing hydrogenase delta subunit